MDYFPVYPIPNYYPIYPILDTPIYTYPNTGTYTYPIPYTSKKPAGDVIYDDNKDFYNISGNMITDAVNFENTNSIEHIYTTN